MRFIFITLITFQVLIYTIVANSQLDPIFELPFETIENDIYEIDSSEGLSNWEENILSVRFACEESDYIFTLSRISCNRNVYERHTEREDFKSICPYGLYKFPRADEKGWRYQIRISAPKRTDVIYETSITSEGYYSKSRLAKVAIGSYTLLPFVPLVLLEGAFLSKNNIYSFGMYQQFSIATDTSGLFHFYLYNNQNDVICNGAQIEGWGEF